LMKGSDWLIAFLGAVFTEASSPTSPSPGATQPAQTRWLSRPRRRGIWSARASPSLVPGSRGWCRTGYVGFFSFPY
jgi:hypothetical protein